MIFENPKIERFRKMLEERGVRSRATLGICA
jgi:hypothetical protein